MRTKPFLSTTDGKIVRTKVDRYGGPCGKNRYATRKLAKAAAKQKSREIGEQVIAYHCHRGCHAWHLGHQYGTKNAQVGLIKVTTSGNLDATCRSTAERERYGATL